MADPSLDRLPTVPQQVSHRAERGGPRDGACGVSQLVRRLYPDIAPGLQAAAAQQVNAHLLHLAEKGAVARDGALWRQA